MIEGTETKDVFKPENVNVLIGCEYSQVIMQEFLALGFNAYSCDLLPCEGPYPQRHFQEDVFEVLKRGWHLAILHPPCTYISYAANKYWNDKGRVFKRLKALEFFARCIELEEVYHVCVENPLGCADGVIRKHDQIIHPYYFGDKDMKKTCLWLKNLPLLVHTKQSDLFMGQTHTNKPEAVYVDKSGKKRQLTESIGGGAKVDICEVNHFPALERQWPNSGGFM